MNVFADWALRLDRKYTRQVTGEKDIAANIVACCLGVEDGRGKRFSSRA